MRETECHSLNVLDLLLPDSVLMKSDSKVWSGLQVVVTRLPAHWTMTDFSSYDDLLLLHLQGGVSLQRHSEGQKQTGYSSPGGLYLDPKLGMRGYVWDGEVATVLGLFLSPSLLHQTITQISTIDPERVELVGRFNFCDPLIHHLLLAMYAELQTGGLFGQSYIEALRNTLVLHLLRYYASMPLQPSTPVGRLSGQQIRQVRDYISDHLAQGVSIADLATSPWASVSPTLLVFSKKPLAFHPISMLSSAALSVQNICYEIHT